MSEEIALTGKAEETKPVAETVEKPVKPEKKPAAEPKKAPAPKAKTTAEPKEREPIRAPKAIFR